VSTPLYERIASLVAGDCPPSSSELPLMALRTVAEKDMFLTLLEIYDLFCGRWT
jgi:hypothetical protein